jgi:hypothetical protein
LFFQSRDMDPGLIELFVDGTARNALPDSGRLNGLDLGSGSVVLMLQRLGWRWKQCGRKIALSGEGRVATKDKSGRNLVRGLTDDRGRHYGEVELAWPGDCGCAIMVGAVRPGLDHDKQ